MTASNQVTRVLVHGGAGNRKPTAAQRRYLTETLVLGLESIKAGSPALDAVELMIRHLEQSGLFNAGVGSRQQLDGVQRMDASIMEGNDLQAGGVAGLEQILHPISAARLVMEDTDHVLLIGKRACHLARHFGLSRLPSTQKPIGPSPSDGLQPQHRRTLALYKKMAHYDTVGAVALDEEGHLAAGASTGGVPMMLPGRVGDSPIIGSGVYADDTAGAISMTGLGEGIMRLTMAKQIALAMQAGQSPARAARKSLTELVQRIQGEAGCLVLAPDGRYAIKHVTPWMSAGQWNGRGQPKVSDHFH